MTACGHKHACRDGIIHCGIAPVSARPPRCRSGRLRGTGRQGHAPGYLVGGISPFGTKQKLPVVMEAGILTFDKIMINAGQRGTMLKLTPPDIRKALTAMVAVVAQS